MRLWHYELIPFLPDSQLIAQWRELNSIYKKQDKHILINYVYEYPKEELYMYSLLVIKEMKRRGCTIKSFDNFHKYFNIDIQKAFFLEGEYPEYDFLPPFENHHNDRYLIQCFYNLQEKYDRGQKDFDEFRYANLKRFIDIVKQHRKEV